MFTDRTEAGRRLAEHLAAYRGDPKGIVLAIPRGAVVIGAEVARALDLPLDVVLVRKIGAPTNPEFAVAAVDRAGGLLRNPSVHVSEEYIAGEADRAREELDRRLAAYRGGRPEPDLRGRTAIVVDDGIATGLTALKAVGYVRDRGAAKVVLAAPVVAGDTVPDLEAAVDELVVLAAPAVFYAVGQFYERFDQVSDAEVVEQLSAVAPR